MMNKRNAALIGALVTIGLIGCGAPGEDSASAPTTDAIASKGFTSAPGNMSAGYAPIHEAARSRGAERAVVRTGSLAVNVEEIRAAEKAIRSIVQESGGYIVTLESTQLAGDEPSLSLTLRVPEKSFENSMIALEELGQAVHKTITASDVTEQILYLDAKMKQIRSPGDAGREMRTLKAERDQLALRASMSTIYLTMRQKPSAANQAANATWGSDTWNAAVSSAMGAFRVIGAVAIWMLAFSPIWGTALFGAVYVGRVARKGRDARRQAARLA